MISMPPHFSHFITSAFLNLLLVMLGMHVWIDGQTGFLFKIKVISTRPVF